MKLIIANWKMYLNPAQSVTLAKQVMAVAPKPRAKVVFCPSFPALFPVAAALKRPFLLGAQDLALADRGAYTGQVSGDDLRALGCRYVIVGHSERRRYLGETDALISQKLAAAFRHYLHPIFCVGESLTQRKRGQARRAVRQQLAAAGRASKSVKDNRLTIAYEPVWAIGTGLVARPPEVVIMHRFIRQEAKRLWPARLSVRVIYGGSVTAKNIGDFLDLPDVQGALIGGASAKSSFAQIIKNIS
ncbi:triose-phosphate isomerase [Candidatus Uhrbacteria bacterium]|nr:triose-phosphate isomerase [Candidatus Uhrbacteria bacterium]